MSLEQLTCSRCSSDDLIAYGERYAICNGCGKIWEKVAVSWDLVEPEDLKA